MNPLRDGRRPSASTRPPGRLSGDRRWITRLGSASICWMLLFLFLMGVRTAAGQTTHDNYREQHERPAALVPLYVSFAALQVVDIHSTMTAINSGAREANPVVRNTMNFTGVFLLKTGTAAGVMLISEKVWPRNRTAAIVTMVALNSAYLTIAANNYRVAARR